MEIFTQIVEKNGQFLKSQQSLLDVEMFVYVSDPYNASTRVQRAHVSSEYACARSMRVQRAHQLAFHRAVINYLIDLIS